MFYFLILLNCLFVKLFIKERSLLAGGSTLKHAVTVSSVQGANVGACGGLWGKMMSCLRQLESTASITNHMVLDKCYRGSTEAAKAVGILSGTSRCRN